MKFGIDKRIITLSAQILSKAISREEALIQINKPPFIIDSIEDDISYVIKKLKLDRKDFDKAFKAENKFFYDYPSYYPLIKKFSGLGKTLSMKIFEFKPGIFEAIEQNI
ncbi:MAG: hypothetical protein GYA62_00590 [Bacteroidales bacterium]|nr:hypothetical protein [Bacteroidales bacterium]